ncbi:Hypothetical predicted protein [Olea europaea subsp. europaea]|uniref:Uncharacterized protein n=1 Tax=Olea europaea subsp. europaea TaxID=158383 RepID=A0A8S0T8T9_OLEEU|nr:Hypothetical predicted protein [Olea europaea subsp. europaea]
MTSYLHKLMLLSVAGTPSRPQLRWPPPILSFSTTTLPARPPAPPLPQPLLPTPPSPHLLHRHHFPPMISSYSELQITTATGHVWGGLWSTGESTA